MTSISDTRTVGNVMETMAYFDGLGRPNQEISIGASPTGKDMIVGHKYDPYGREAEMYLPYVKDQLGGNYSGSWETEQAGFYDDMFLGETPYSVTDFEKSPLNRVMKQGAPGTAWQLDQHPVRYDYQSNAANEVLWISINNSDFIEAGSSTYYPANKLYKNITKDENWDASRPLLHTTEEFIDLQGNVILKKSYVENSSGGVDALETYYVYDDFNSLRLVIPPKAVPFFQNDINFTSWDSPIVELCYYYEYDGRKRMIMKQLPQAGRVSMVYDLRDRLVMTQDQNQHNASTPKWSFIMYDIMNRPIMTGEFENNDDQVTLQGYFNSYGDDAGEILYETTTTANFTSDIPVGYTVGNSYPSDLRTNYLTKDQVQSVTYYDDYWVLSAATVNDDLSDTRLVYNNNHASNNKGRTTVTCVKLLDQDAWQNSAMYYDKYGREIHTVQLMHNGAINRITNTYSFTGEIVSSIQNFTYDDDYIIAKGYNYDHAGRLLSVNESYDAENGDYISTKTTNKYDELGQLKEKYLGVDNQSKALQRVDYDYNIRGWLTSINDPDVLGYDLFGMDLQYNSGANPQYNGNISGTSWKDREFGTLKQYNFTYDALNRLTGAAWNGNAAGGFSMTVNGYDLNGNIKGLSRYSNGYLIDNLVYNYYSTYSNRLSSVVDNANSSIGFNDANYSGSYGYTYDSNGNMHIDLYKQVNIDYNRLNLPEQVSSRVNGTTIQYTYDASGVKLKKATNSSTTDYLANFVYQDNVLDFIITDEGRVVRTAAGDYQYEYYLKDHLGNTRVRFKDNNGVAEILEATDYYPFGMTMAMQTSEGTNKYLYNGKELQDDNLGNGTNLDWYDYGARMYDPALGRFHTQDAFAEKYYDFSPYQYGANNPICNIDVNGDSIWYTMEDNVITMHVTGKVMNNSNDDIDMDEAIADMTEDLADSFSGEIKLGDDTYELKTDIQLEAAESMDDVKDSDHLIVFADGSGDEGTTRGASNEIGGKVIYLYSGDYPTNSWYSPGWSYTRSFLHEFGHTAGLEHNYGFRNLMKQRGAGTTITSEQRGTMYGATVNRGSNSYKLLNGERVPNPILKYYDPQKRGIVRVNVRDVGLNVKTR